MTIDQNKFDTFVEVVSLKLKNLELRVDQLQHSVFDTRDEAQVTDQTLDSLEDSIKDLQKRVETLEIEMEAWG